MTPPGRTSGVSPGTDGGGMKLRVLRINMALLSASAWLACGLASGPGEESGRSLSAHPRATASAPETLPATGDSSATWALAFAQDRRSSPGSPVAGDSYCRARFGDHAGALDGCQRRALESYRRLEPVFRRASGDAMAMESKRLEGCVRRHGGQLGVDWTLVEHCFSYGVR